MGGYYVGKPPGKVEMIFAIETGNICCTQLEFFLPHAGYTTDFP